MQDLNGQVVSEEEVALDLGFTDVYEFRRWQTDQGYEIMNLQERLLTARSDANHFRWHGQRMLAVLERAGVVLERVGRMGMVGVDPPQLQKLLLAIKVVCGHGVDWDNVLDDWLAPNVLPSGETDYVI